MKRLLQALSWGLMAALPLVVMLGLEQFSARYLAALFLAVALLRLLLLRSGGRLKPLPLTLSVLLLLVASAVLWGEDPRWFRFYPVAVNGCLLIVFGVSLLGQGPPVIERLARLTEPDLPSAAVHYTRQVTAVWCAFFALNGAAALYTALASSLEVWAWYNGAVAYCLIGLLFAGEWLLRRRVRRHVHA